MFREWAMKEGLLSDGQVKDIEKDVHAIVEDAVKFAEESPKPVRLFKGLPSDHSISLQASY
jgi:TPP-dependent pyruvate/acetoin dehydrogenase alpha subunit